MAFDYTGLEVGTVQPLIREFGDTGQLVVPGPEVGEAWESRLGDPTNHSVNYVRTVFKKADNMGTLVEAGDVLFLVSTEGVTVDPNLADRMLVDGVEYQIIRIDPLKPGPVVMLWKVHARK